MSNDLASMGIDALVGIDLGTSCGWAVLHPGSGDRIASGTWDLSVRRGEGAGFRVIRARRCMAELHATFGRQVWAYELVRRHLGVDAAHVYGALEGAMQALLDDLDVDYAGVPVGTIKRQATGKGNAGKEAMVAAARERWSLDICGEDEADALWVAECLRLGATA